MLTWSGAGGNRRGTMDPSNAGISRSLPDRLIDGDAELVVVPPSEPSQASPPQHGALALCLRRSWSEPTIRWLKGRSRAVGREILRAGPPIIHGGLKLGMCGAEPRRRGGRLPDLRRRRLPSRYGSQSGHSRRVRRPACPPSLNGANVDRDSLPRRAAGWARG